MSSPCAVLGVSLYSVFITLPLSVIVFIFSLIGITCARRRLRARYKFRVSVYLFGNTSVTSYSSSIKADDSVLLFLF